MKWTAVFLFLFMVPLHAGHWGPYELMESILDRARHPRLLNSTDIAELRPNDPQPLVAPEGDFNGDKRSDQALSGVYDLPGNGPRYFLLVATPPSKTGKPRTLFFREYLRPVFIHRAGTTGEGDPGDQAFSISFCSDCDDGFDFYWRVEEGKFETRPWVVKKKRLQKTVEVPAEEVPEEIIDKALRLAGAVPDVQSFVKELRAGNRKLGTRVARSQDKSARNIYTVRIFERIDEKEVPYMTLDVDIEKDRVVGKRRASAR